MPDSFADFGLRTELIDAAESLGYRAPTALQRAAIPVLRRGGNAVLHASSGAGVTAGYGLPLLDRALAAEATEQQDMLAIVVTPTQDEANRVAAALGKVAARSGVRVQAQGSGWLTTRPAHVQVLAAASLADAPTSSTLKLESVQTVVLDGLPGIRAGMGDEQLETFLSAIPREAQRVVIAGAVNRDLDQFTERHVRRALHIPPRAAAPDEAPPPLPPTSTLAYAVTSELDKISLAGDLITGSSSRPVVFSRSDDRAAELAEELTVRGFRVGPVDDAESDVAVASTDARFDEGWPLSFDVPFDAHMLQNRHATGGVVIVTPRELPHLRRIATEANFGLRPLAHARQKRVDEVDAFRDRLRTALQEEDIDVQILLLQPLFDEFSPVEVAAAAAALLRKRMSASAPVATGASAAAAAGPRPYVRLFVALGERDGIRPGDLVGAIAGEVGIPGEQVGRIEIRDNFSVVEVPSDVADKVIKALNGTTMKGRSVRVDYDRRGSAAGGGGGGRASRTKGPGQRGPRPAGDRMRRS